MTLPPRAAGQARARCTPAHMSIHRYANTSHTAATTNTHHAPSQPPHPTTTGEGAQMMPMRFATSSASKSPVKRT